MEPFALVTSGDHHVYRWRIKAMQSYRSLIVFMHVIASFSLVGCGAKPDSPTLDCTSDSTLTASMREIVDHLNSNEAKTLAMIVLRESTANFSVEATTSERVKHLHGLTADEIIDQYAKGDELTLETEQLLKEVMTVPAPN